MHEPVENYLGRADGAASVLAHARLLMRAQRAYDSFAPGPLARSSSVANIKLGNVVIHADNGAVAAKLRQMAQSLAGEFLKRGFECNGVTIKVQARPPAVAPPSSTLKPLSASTGNELKQLAAQLPDDSPLKRGLEGFLARAAIKAE